MARPPRPEQSDRRRSAARGLPDAAGYRRLAARTFYRCRRSPSGTCRSRRHEPRCSPRWSRNRRGSWLRCLRCHPRRFRQHPRARLAPHFRQRPRVRLAPHFRQRPPCRRRPRHLAACCRLDPRSSLEPPPLPHLARRWHRKRHRYRSPPCPMGSCRTNRCWARYRRQQPSRALPLAISVIVRSVPRPRAEYG